MDNERKQGLSEAGIAYDEILKRLSGREELVIRLLKKFPGEKCFADLERSMRERDYKNAFSSAHTLKGVAANLAMTTLNQVTGVLVEKLRAEDYRKVEDDFEKVKTEYYKIMEAIEKLILTDD